MLKSHRMLSIAMVALFLIGMTAAASAGNLLANPGFESGLSGWGAFGNVYAEASNPPQFVPYEGNGLVSMFGNWWGVFNVSGIFQEFPTVEGAAWTMACKTRHWSGDPMTADGVDDNWVVQKIAFFDAGGTEIGGVESRVLDGTWPTDVWFDNAAITGFAPPGTAKVQALVLYLQPLWDGGACHVDNVVVIQSGSIGTEETTWGGIKALYSK
jgi:hypothetical protein